jgi:hypothetical protein
MVSLAMPTAHKLPVLFGVADCGWPLSCSVVRSMLPSFPLRKDIADFSFSGRGYCSGHNDAERVDGAVVRRIRCLGWIHGALLR